VARETSEVECCQSLSKTNSRGGETALSPSSWADYNYATEAMMVPKHNRNLRCPAVKLEKAIAGPG